MEQRRNAAFLFGRASGHGGAAATKRARLEARAAPPRPATAPAPRRINHAAAEPGMASQGATAEISMVHSQSRYFYVSIDLK